MSKQKEAKQDHYGKIVLMAKADGYCMVRRPRCIPFVVAAKKWEAMPSYTPRTEGE